MGDYGGAFFNTNDRMSWKNFQRQLLPSKVFVNHISYIYKYKTFDIFIDIALTSKG